jgi:hypothetical protein
MDADMLSACTCKRREFNTVCMGMLGYDSANFVVEEEAPPSGLPTERNTSNPQLNVYVVNLEESCHSKKICIGTSRRTC